MYMIKNALRCISRSKGRNILIGVIVLVIAVATCIGLSIRQASESTRASLLEDLSVTATISFDRQSMMSSFRGQGASAEEQALPEDGGVPEGGFDRDGFSALMGEASSLTLEEYELYAGAPSVKDFYYSLTVSVNGNDDLEPVSATSEESNSENNSVQNDPFGGRTPGMGGMMGGGQGLFSQGDFQIVGYSSEEAMTNFVSGVATVTEGQVFEEGTSDLSCLVSQELAAYNELEVGDSITVTSLENEEETYTLTIAGIFTDSSANEMSFSMGGFSASDPANQIYMSYTALQSIVTSSESANTAEDGEEGEYSPLTGSLAGTYVFADVESYESFEQEARELGLADTYTISSQDIASYESSLTPLETLSTMAGWFLLVILVIGAIILIVLNIFNVRERKYEIGVLCAMGMKKGKVALQFLTEIFVVTLCAVVVGAVIGGVSAVPVTNALLKNQTAAQEKSAENVEMNFGRGGKGEMPEGGQMPGRMEKPENMGEMLQMGADYITEVNSAMNLTVVFQMLLVAVLLTLAGGVVSMLFIMRYEPLKILSNRD